MHPRLTAIWQYENPNERQWIEEIFGPFLERQVFDGERRLVLDNCILFDSFTYSEPPEYYRQFHGKNAFLVEFLDEYYQGGDYSVYTNFRGVFRNFWSALFNPQLVRALPLGYQNHVRAQGSFVPASSREFVWSMVGDCHKSWRPDATKALVPIEPHFLKACDAAPDATAAGAASFGREAYRDILLRSRFVPCPMGNANIESYRTYEALECGAIPIVERRWTLNYYEQLLGPDFPGIIVPNWDAARRQVLRLSDVPDQLNELQNRCIEWWSAYKRSLSAAIGDFLTERSRSTHPVKPLRGVTKIGPVLQWLELTRHHSLRALVRRLCRQVSRLREEGRWRQAKTGWPPRG